jgi:hypothetical protein
MDVFGDGDHKIFTARTLVTFAAEGGGTRMDVRQSYIVYDAATLPMIEGAATGWGETLDRLESEVGRMQSTDAVERSVVHATLACNVPMRCRSRAFARP